MNGSRFVKHTLPLFFTFIYFTGMAQSLPEKQVSQQIDIQHIDHFRLEGWTEITFVEGPPSMTITGTQAELDRLQVEREEDQIFLWEEEPESSTHQQKESLTVVISCRDIASIQIKGAASVLLNQGFDREELSIEINGVSDVTMYLDASVINGSITGVADLELAGSARTGELVIEAIGDLNIQEFDSGEVSVLTSGIASIR